MGCTDPILQEHIIQKEGGGVMMSNSKTLFQVCTALDFLKNLKLHLILCAAAAIMTTLQSGYSGDKNNSILKADGFSRQLDTRRHVVEIENDLANSKTKLLNDLVRDACKSSMHSGAEKSQMTMKN